MSTLYLTYCKKCYKSIYNEDKSRLKNLCIKCSQKDKWSIREKKINQVLKPNPLTGLKNLMKKIFYPLTLICVIYSCQQKKEWNYEITKEVYFNKKSYRARWYCDSVDISDTSISYRNSDGTRVIILSPYILKDNSH